MPSAKGKPTDPKLKEDITKSKEISYLFPLQSPLKSPLPLIVSDPFLTADKTEVKQQPNKNGSGKGKMAAWKASKIAKEYEAEGGDYENEPGSKDKPKKGPPEKKSEEEKASELKEVEKEKEEDAKETASDEPNGADDKTRDTEVKDEPTVEKRGPGRPKNAGSPAGPKKGPKPKKEPRQGTRSSARQQEKSQESTVGTKIDANKEEEQKATLEKRKNVSDEPTDENDEEEESEQKPAKKSKNGELKEVEEEKEKSGPKKAGRKAKK